MVERILEKPKLFKTQKLPFKHVRKSIYQTNHFSGEMVSAQGKDFKFKRNIHKFEWEVKHTKTPQNIDYSKPYKINLRLSELAQVKELEKYIKKIGSNPIYSIEYGEILSTCDLATSSFSELITKVRKFAYKYGIKFQLSTPKILIERDFDRVYEYVKQLLLTEPAPDSLIINNIGYFWVFINDNESGLHYDLLKWAEELAPYNIAKYQHNLTGEDNADAHLKRTLLGREVVVAITKGQLDFGPWEQIFYAEFDGQRDKRILIKVMGE